MARVLVVGDIHAPATHPAYLAFCLDQQAKYETRKVVMIGDVWDEHLASVHPKEPDAANVPDEIEQAREQTAKWHQHFPKAEVCDGNHDRRYEKRAKENGVPLFALKSRNDIYGTPTWKWHYEAFFIDGVMYHHGEDKGGQTPARASAVDNGVPVVCGHHHHALGVNYLKTMAGIRWGMNVGCGVDVDHPAMRYGRGYAKKPMLGCGVVLDGVPFPIPMPHARGEKYHRSKFEKRRRARGAR